MNKFDPYDALIPVCLETEVPRRVSQIGTAVFVELYGEPFLYTAAHVTDDRTKGNLLVPTDDGLVPIDGYMAHVDLLPERARLGDDIDIAYYRLSSRFARKLQHRFSALPQARCELIASSAELTVCSASGYPASKSGRTADGGYRSEVFSFRGVAAEAATYDSLNLSPEFNIVLHFSKKSAVDAETLARYPTPSLRGISGGGIFAWPEGEELSEDWSLPKLVGLVHAYKEREGLIIGTTLVPVLTAVQLGRMKSFGGVT